MEKQKQVVAYVRVTTQEQTNSSYSLEAQRKTLREYAENGYMKNAVSYVRVSSEDQKKHGYSIGQQITNNMQFALQNGYKLVKTFKDEGISAKNMDRPALQELLAYCMDETNEVEAVIVWKLDRISRNVADYTATLSPFFAQNNIQLLTVTDINGEGLDVEMMRQISMVFAERERKMTALRTKEGIRGKVALGQFPYHAPIGYENIEIKGSKYKKMVIDEENAFFVRQAYNMCLQGDSLTTITNKLYKMGFRNKHGNRHPKSSVEYMLHNIAYIGKFYYDDVLVEDTDYPPLISEATYYAVQEKLNTPSKTRQLHTKFPYNECMTCAKCGCYLTGELKVKKSKKSTREYIYYHCTGNRGGDCKKGSYIRQEIIDEAFTSVLKQITIPENVHQLVIDGLKEVHKEHTKDYEMQKKSIRKRIDKIDKTIKSVFENGFNNHDEGMMKNIEEWKVERRTLFLEEQEMLKATKTFFVQSNLLLNFCKDCHTAFLKGNAEQKRKIVKMVCSNFSYDGSNIVIEPNPIFKAVIKNGLSNKKLPELGSNQQPTG